jgi:hypothetical protein
VGADAGQQEENGGCPSDVPGALISGLKTRSSKPQALKGGLLGGIGNETGRYTRL